MDGESIKERGTLNGASVDWTVAGTGDFDGDGMADLLWHNPQTGANTVWLLTGAERKARGSIPRVSSGWQPVGVIDMDADGMADILWRNTSGANRLWLMNAMSRTASLQVQGVGDSLWEVVAVGDVAD